MFVEEEASMRDRRIEELKSQRRWLDQPGDQATLLD
jgi:hypothetical protein